MITVGIMNHVSCSANHIETLQVTDCNLVCISSEISKRVLLDLNFVGMQSNVGDGYLHFPAVSQQPLYQKKHRFERSHENEFRLYSITKNTNLMKGNLGAITFTNDWISSEGAELITRLYYVLTIRYPIILRSLHS